MISLCRTLIAGFATLWIVCGAVAAETNAGLVLTLNDVVRLLGDRNPRIRAESEMIAAARADRRTAAAFPNPKLGLEHQQPTENKTLFSGDRQEQVSVELPLLIPGQRSSRIAKADADIAAAEAHFTAERASIAADACVSFIHLLALQRRTEVLSNALSEVTHLRDTISGRLANGAASEYDLARVEVETGVLASHYEAARAELSAEAGQLATALSITNGLPAATGSFEPWRIPAQDLTDVISRSALSPSAMAAARESAAAEAAIKASRRNRWPDVSLEGGRTWTRHPYGAADFVGLTVEIPIFDTRRGQLDRAKSEARAAEDRRIAAIAQAEATIRQLAQTVERRQAAVERYHREIEPRLTRLKEMSGEAYLNGRHTILELLDAEEARREVALENIETTSALVEAQIRFLGATGQLPTYLGVDVVTAQRN